MIRRGLAPYAFLFCLLFGLMGCDAAPPEWSVPLSVDRSAGCRIEGGRIRLFDALPTQTEDGSVVLEAEAAQELHFQDEVFELKAKRLVKEMEQVYAHSGYTPQEADDASAGKFIDYTTRATWQFSINKAGAYTIWARQYLPSKLYWRYNMQVDRGEIVDVNMPKEPTTIYKEWYWKKAHEVTLEPGTHRLRILRLHNGKRVDKFVIRPKGAGAPEGMGPKASPKRRVDTGHVVTQPVQPSGLERWRRIAYDTRAGDVGIDLDISFDGGDTWTGLGEGGAFPPALRTRNDPARIRLALTRRDNGQSPSVGALAAVYRVDREAFAIVENDLMQLVASRRTGSIAGIRNKKTGSTYAPFGMPTPAFEVLVKKPGDPEQRWIDAAEAELVSFEAEARRLRTAWTVMDGRIVIRFDIRLDDTALARWDVTVENNHPTHDVLQVMAPRLVKLSIADDPAHDTLIWPYTAGDIVDHPADKGEMRIGYPGHAGFAFLDLYTGEGDDAEGLYLASHDPEVVGTEFVSRPDPDRQSLEFQIIKRHRIRAGGGVRTYRFALGVHEGDWHWAARRYREFFYAHHDVNRYRPWLRNTNAWFVGRSTGHVGRWFEPFTYERWESDFKRATFYGVDYIQFWGITFNGAGGTYFYPRKERGGAEMLDRVVDRWRSVGGSCGIYYHANSFSPYWTLTPQYFDSSWDTVPERLHPPSWDWFVRNKGYTSPEYEKPSKEDYLARTREVDRIRREKDKEKFVGNLGLFHNWMNWHRDEYPDYLRSWLRFHVKEMDENTAYLDTFAFGNYKTEWSPFSNSHGEGDRAEIKTEWIAETMRELRTYESSFCALSEGVNDIFGPWLFFMISHFSKEPRVLRYACPDHIYFEGQSNGQWTRPRAKAATFHSFLYGNKLDILREFPEVMHTLRLRQRVAPFLNHCVFDDRVGLAIEGDGVEAFVHRIGPGTERFVKHSGSTIVTATVHNPKMIDNGRLRYALPDGFEPRAAWTVSLYDDTVNAIDIERDGNTVVLPVATAELSAIVLVDEAVGEERWTAIPVVADRGTIRLRLANFAPEPATVTASIDIRETTFERNERSVTLPPGEIREIVFRDNNPRDAFRMGRVTVREGDTVKRYTTAMGDTGKTMPPPPKPERRGPAQADIDDEANRPAVTIFSLDFEDGGDETTDKNPYAGKRALVIDGNGKFAHKRYPVELEPDTRYRFHLAIKKGQKVPEGWRAYTAILQKNEAGQWKILCYMGPKVASDGRWHPISKEFTTPKTINNPTLYLYNKNSKGTAWFDDVTIERR